jgi:hypothetical protein
MVSCRFMPSLHLTIHRITSLANREFVRAAQDLDEVDRAEVLNNAQITADYVGSGVELEIVFMNFYLFKRVLPLTIYMVENEMGREDVEKTVTTTMAAHLNLMTQMHFARLAHMFPRSIAHVSTEYDHRSAQDMLIVEFRNGHKAIGPVSEAKTELFHARCAMLYDLPELTR